MKNKKKLVIILLIICVSLLTVNFIGIGNDYYWHIKAGNYMFENHTILTHDIFSWFVKGKYWMSHEWLYEYIIYMFKIIFGNYHIIIYIFSNILLLLLILFLHNKNNYSKNSIFTIIWLILFIFINISLLTPRPHLISNCLLALTLYLLYDLRKNENSKKIYFLPIVSLLWANIHGGSSNLSYLLCILFIVTGLFNIKSKYIKIEKITNKQLRKYLIVLGLIIVSLIINPHGIKMIFYPYENIFNTFMQQNIGEWKAINLKNWYHYVYILTIIWIIVTFIKSKKKINIIDLLLFIFMSYLGLRSVRFWNYIYIASSFYIFDYIKERKDDKNTSEILIFVSIIASCALIFNINKVEKRLSKDNMISTKMINKIKEENPKKLFNMYDFGGYLIYNDIDVFVDGRADLYSNYNFKDYINISNTTKNYTELLKKYNFDYFIVKKEFKIYKYLEDSDNYAVILKDKNSILYKKKGA